MPKDEHPEHGMTSEVHCQHIPVFKIDQPWVKSMEEKRVRSLQMVKLLIYRGKVARNFCPHLRKELRTYECRAELGLHRLCHLAPDD